MDMTNYSFCWEISHMEFFLSNSNINLWKMKGRLQIFFKKKQNKEDAAAMV